MANGYDPEVDSTFSFKNKVDNFFLQHLRDNHIFAELYIVKRTSESNKDSVKIAEANLPLRPLLE